MYGHWRDRGLRERRRGSGSGQAWTCDGPLRRHRDGGMQDARKVAVCAGAHVGRAAGVDVAEAVEAAADGGGAMSTEQRRALTSVELLDAAVWREIGSEE